MKRWFREFSRLLACSVLGTKLIPLAWLSRFGTTFLMPNGGGVWEVDGRGAHQWIASVLAYLEWRAGDSWRQISDRFHPEREYYICGYRTLMQAWLAPEAADALAQPIPFPVKPKPFRPRKAA